MPPGQVQYVQWTDPEHRLGRKVCLDGSDKIKAIVAYKVPISSYENATDIIKDTGAIMTRRFRWQMDSWCQVLRRERELSFFNGPFPVDSDHNCVVCSICTIHGVDQASSECGELWICKVCLTPWHIGCARIYGGFQFGEKCPLC